MSINISIQDCRDLLADKLSHLDDTAERVRLTNAYNEFVTVTSLEEMFILAKQLLKELDEYDNSYVEGIKFTTKQQKTYAKLKAPFYHYDGITPNEYNWILENAGFDVVLATIENKRLPVPLLIEGSFLTKHVNAPYFAVLRRTVADVKRKREVEIISYYRNQVPNSTHMSDNMVLSVAGVTV